MKKRLTGILLAIVLALTFLLPAGASAEVLSSKVEMPNDGGSLHLRSKTSKTSASAGYVQDGDSILVYLEDAARDNEDELWVKVKVERTGKSGYIKSKYIRRTYGPMVYVNASGGSLNVRKGPGTNYASLGYVKHKQSITVLNRGTTWSKIKVASTGTVGYIKTKYIFGATSGVSSSNTSTGSSSSSAVVTKPSTYDAAAIMTRTAFGTVNVRKGAGTNYASVTKLSRGEKLYVTGKTGDWYKVQTVNGKTGYVRNDYVSFGVTVKTTGSVNFRKGAGTSYGVIRTLPNGTSVVLHSVNGKWAKVSCSGKTGYVSTSYLKLY